MTAPANMPDRQRDRRMEDVKQELARVMEREGRLRAALREDRMRQMGLDVSAMASTDRLRREP